MKTGRPRILIVKLSAIGDVVHTVPALTALRRHFPQARIAWLVEEAAAPLICGHRALDRVLISKRKRWLNGLASADWRRNLSAMTAFLRDLREVRYDMLIDFQASLKGALLIAAARADRKIGFGSGMQHQEGSYLVLNEKVPMVSMEMHALERGLKLIEAIGVRGEKDPVYDLPIQPADHRTADTLLRSGGWQAGRPAIAINPVAKWKTKLWAADKFARLADLLIERCRVALFFTGDRGDHAVIEEIQARMRQPCANLAGRTSLLELAAVYQRMACVVSTDTGPMHIAAAVDVPVVALFGPTAPWRTGPYGPKNIVVSAPVPCRPCFKRDCRCIDCMQGITVEMALRACLDILEG